jgi:hypothetical protein
VHLADERACEASVLNDPEYAYEVATNRDNSSVVAAANSGDPRLLLSVHLVAGLRPRHAARP